jgi:UDP-GlcNAc:undecaprenyl-phosphate GlcNAc-1-phosphate transferase
VNIDPYVAALVAGCAVAFLASALLNVGVQRLPAAFPAGGLAGGPSKAPPVGGIALLIGFAVAPFLAALASDEASIYFGPKHYEFFGYLAAVGLVFLTGLIDDWRAMPPWQKIGGQLIAGCAVFAAGYHLEVIGPPWGGAIHLGLLALPATLIWVVFFTNALNLIDGKDGLATGVAVFAAAALAAVAANTEHTAVALLFVGLAGAGLGFLPFNLPPASMILGDNGSLVFGFVLSTLSIRGATGAEGAVFLSVPFLAMGFPVFDTLLSTTRRLLAGRSPFSGDLDHIHHRFEALSDNPRVSLGLLYFLSAGFATAALATHYLEGLAIEAGIFFAVVGVVIAVIWRLGYTGTLWNSDRVVTLRRRAGHRGGR